MKQNTIRDIILAHFVIVVIVGFFFYDNTNVFYAGVELATILLYILCGKELSKRNQILIQGLILMTALETIDYVFKANTFDPTNLEHVHERLVRDAIILGVCSILTIIRFLKCPKYMMQS